MKNLLLVSNEVAHATLVAIGLTLASYTVQNPAFAQTAPLPRATFDPLYVDTEPRVVVVPIDTWGGDPEVDMKEYCLKRLTNWYWHLHNDKDIKHGYIPPKRPVDSSDLGLSNPPDNVGLK